MEIIKFNATDNTELEGILYHSERNITDSKKIILAVHGMTSNCFKKRDMVISKYANENNIDYFCFNNRGSEIVRYISKRKDGKKNKTLAGTAYEDVLDGYYDICGAILKLIDLGYTNIYLQGHSLGCTKIVYTYNKLKDENTDLLKYIKGIMLLSLVDIPNVLKVYLGDNYNKYLKLAEEKLEDGKDLELMPKESFIHPISVKTFLRYIKYNEEINFSNIEKDENLSILNRIEVPIFMRWGSINEMIVDDAKLHSEKINNIISNKNKNISYVEGADHGYHGKENEIAEQIIKFIS